MSKNIYNWLKYTDYEQDGKVFEIYNDADAIKDQLYCMWEFVVSSKFDEIGYSREYPLYITWKNHCISNRRPFIATHHIISRPNNGYKRAVLRIWKEITVFEY